MLRPTRPDHRTFPRVRLLASCATSADAGLGLIGGDRAAPVVSPVLAPNASLTGSDPRQPMTHPAFRIGALAMLAALGLSLTACATDPLAIPPNQSRRGMSPAAGEPIATMSVTPATADASPAPTGRRGGDSDTAVSIGPATTLGSAGASPTPTGRTSGERRQ